MEMQVLYFGQVHGSCKTIDFNYCYPNDRVFKMNITIFFKKKISERYPQKIKSEVSAGIFN